MSDDTIHFLLFQDCLIRVSDNRAILDRIIHEVPTYLKSQGRPALTWFGVRGVQKALQDLHAAGLEARILFREQQRIPRIARYARSTFLTEGVTRGILEAPPSRPGFDAARKHWSPCSCWSGSRGRRPLRPDQCVRRTRCLSIVPIPGAAPGSLLTAHGKHVILNTFLPWKEVRSATDLKARERVFERGDDFFPALVGSSGRRRMDHASVACQPARAIPAT